MVAETDQVPGYFERLRDRATDIALQGASRYIDAEIIERAQLRQADTSTGVDQGQQRVPETDASQATVGQRLFGGNLIGWAVLGVGAALLYVAVK